jgi:glycosyltransferase involved in cell wall biosynthesis
VRNGERPLSHPAHRFRVPRYPTPDTETTSLKILMIAPTPFFADRGCHVRIYEEARALQGAGHEVRLATYHLGRDLPEIPTTRTITIPWYRKLSAGPSWHKPYLDILLFFTALRLARTFRPDLIHAHLHEGAFIGIFLKGILGVPLVFDCQGGLTAEMADHGFIRKGSLLYRMFRRLEGFINRRADLIIASSGHTATELRTFPGTTASLVTTLIDGVDSQRFRPLDRAAARRELGLPADAVLVAFLGVLNSYQGLDILLEVIGMVGARDPKAHFLIMGFPAEEYRRRAAARGLAGAATFTGRIDYALAPLYLSAADVAVSPKVSLTEANGKLFNYMACGLPTVVFETPVNREILGDDGIYAAFGDAADFAARLERLLADGEQRRELSRRLRERAVREHSWQARGTELVGLYRRVLGARARG